jgi:ABC-type glycerol-3-phosphate transport system substrate-binding protein
MRSRSHKNGSLAVVGLVLVVILAACGTDDAVELGGSDADEPADDTDGQDAAADDVGDVTTLTVLSLIAGPDPIGEVFAETIERFEAEYGIAVEVLQGGEDTPDVFETMVLAGNEPELVVVNLVEGPLEWLNEGVVVELTDYLRDWGLQERITPAAIDEWTDAEGRVQGIPFSGFQWPLLYNTRLLSEAGVTDVPQTTDELIAAATSLRAAGIAPVVVGGNDWSGQKLFFQIVQSYMEPAEAAQVFATGGFCDVPTARQGVELFVELRDAGVFADDTQGFSAEQMTTQFYTEEAAIIPAGSWAFAGVPEDVIDNVHLGGFPVPPDGRFGAPTAYQGYTGPGFWISNNGVEKLGAVRALIEMMYDEATIQQFVERADLITPVAFDQDATQPNNPLTLEALSDLQDRVEYAVMPDLHIPGTRADAVIRGTSLAYSPSVDAQGVCEAMDAAY